jgi:hypothetical protein
MINSLFADHSEPLSKGSGFRGQGHNVMERSMYAKQEDDEGGCGRGGANAVDPQRTH